MASDPTTWLSPCRRDLGNGFVKKDHGICGPALRRCPWTSHRRRRRHDDGDELPVLHLGHREKVQITLRTSGVRMLTPSLLGHGAYYDSMVKVNLGEMESMIALPFHPSKAYTINASRRTRRASSPRLRKNATRSSAGGQAGPPPQYQ